jgi:toxin-antitoxin system PIN domain toxin
MTFLVDANILIYLASRSIPFHGRVRSFLAARVAQRARVFTTWGILYEFLRVMTHARILPNPLTAAEALSFVDKLFAETDLAILIPTEEHRALLTLTCKETGAPAGNLFHDIHTAVLMREHGIAEIVTCDADFLRFKFLKVTNPLKA